MKSTRCLLFLPMVFFCAVFASAQEQNTEIQGFYQSYHDFSFKTGLSDYDIPSTKLEGGGFVVAQNLAPWFAFWTQFSFYGYAEAPNTRARLFNNLYGIRYQTEQHGPFRLYGKAGLGYTNYRLDVVGLGSGLSDTAFSFAYGGGLQIWMSEHFGAVLDAAHTINSLPNLTNSPDREKWDSGLTFTAGLAVRF